MRTIISILTFLILLSGCAKVAKVTLQTVPSGGTVSVVGVSENKPDGSVVELPPGEYVLTAEMEGYTGGTQQLLIDRADKRTVMVALGSSHSSVTIHTLPPGEVVKIAETGQILADGESAVLPPGKYSLVLEKEGYRDSLVTVEVSGGVPVAVTVPRGQGYGKMEVRAEPADSVLFLEGGEPLPLPLEMEVEAGVYAVIVERKGYLPYQGQAAIDAGQTTTLSVNLKKIPTSAEVVVQTVAGGEIFFRNKLVGTGRAALGTLPFGSYQVRGEKTVDSRSRLVGEANFALNQTRARTVELKLDRQEYFFEGRWLPRSEAAASEAARYVRQRVARPVAVSIGFSPEAGENLTGGQLATQLQALLRVGDRIVFRTLMGERPVWKRFREMTPEFADQVAAVFESENVPVLWMNDDPVEKKHLEESARSLIDVAFALHSARNPLPLIDLVAEQLRGAEVNVARAGADGDLTLLVAGGQGLAMGGIDLKGNDGLVIKHIPAGNETIRISWQTRPERILLVSDRLPALQTPLAVPLLIKEKKMIDLAQEIDVRELYRLSNGPDFGGWQRQILDTSGPLGSQVDLRKDEIGPHDLPGEYQRIWIVRFAEGAATSQRQLSVVYRVGNDLLDGATDTFFRRPREGTVGQRAQP